MAQTWKVTVKTPWRKFAKGLTVQVVGTGTNKPTSTQIFEAFETQLGIKKENGANPSFDIVKA